MSCQVWEVGLGQEEVEWFINSNCYSDTDCISERYAFSHSESHTDFYNKCLSNRLTNTVSNSHLCIDRIKTDACANARYLHLSRRVW